MISILITNIIFLSIINLSSQTCSFTQYCSDPTNTSSCELPKPIEFEPFKYNSTEIICPEFVNKSACCNGGQNLLMRKIIQFKIGDNFKTIDFIFSSAYDGCDICAINLKRLWCQFTCNETQSTFGKY